MCPKCFQWDLQIPLPWNISWEFVSVSLQFIILKLGSRDWNSGRENDLCKTCGVTRGWSCFLSGAARTALSWRWVAPCSSPPLGGIIFGCFMELNCPWSLSHTGIALGIPIALEDADGDFATHAEICLKFDCSSNIQLVKALNISTGFLRWGCWLLEGAGDKQEWSGSDERACLVAEDPRPTLPEVTGSGDTVPWSVTMRKLGGIREGPTTEVTVSCRSRQRFWQSWEA